MDTNALKSELSTLRQENDRLRRAEKNLRQQNEYLSALHETSLGFMDLLDKEELLESILNRAGLLTGTQHGYIYLLDPLREEMQMRVGMGFFKSQLGRRA